MFESESVNWGEMKASSRVNKSGLSEKSTEYCQDTLFDRT